MRGFTPLADRLPPRTLVELLNRYFDCQVPDIMEHGGEVLKCIGDGLLAIFPVASDESDAEWVCGEVLAVARTVRAKIAALRGALAIEGLGDVRFGLALHLGEVLYGNIGGGGPPGFSSLCPPAEFSPRGGEGSRQPGRTGFSSGRVPPRRPP